MLKEKLKRIVTIFSQNISQYKQHNFNEQMTRQQYIDEFLKLLGWDISNPNGLSFQDREIVVEEYSNSSDRPDYTIRMNGISKFYVEAKKVNVDISKDIDSVLQARRYGWNAGHIITVLTNFEYLAIYLTYDMPTKDDKVEKYRYKLYHYTEYVDKFEEIYQLLSRESVINGLFDIQVKNIQPKDATYHMLDNVFLEQLNEWRVLIANDLIENSSNVYDNLNEDIQQFINQLVFLRFAEDNRFENNESLKNEILKHDSYYDYFKALDKKYNSGLFKNSTIINTLSDGVLKQIVENLYFPNVSYDFSIIDLSILSKIYENFLQKEIVIIDNTAVLQQTKNAKITSVISTPHEIVTSMVHQALSDQVMNKSEEDILNMKIVDLAVGSGIFLIEAYNFLENYLIDLYANKNKVDKNKVDKNIVPFEVKKKILENVLIGYDINNQAVQLTRFSLLLRLLSNEHKERIEQILPILPSLDKTIIHANSLVSMDDIDITQLSKEELYEIVPMDRDEEQNMEFDVILGNPPYLNTKKMKESLITSELQVYNDKYISSNRQYDKYFLFIERAIQKLKDTGCCLLLVPNKFIHIEAAKKLRNLILEKCCLSKIFDFGSTQVFDQVSIYVCILKLEKHNHKYFEYVNVSNYSDIYNNKKGIQFNFSDLTDNYWFLTDNKKLLKQYEYASNHFPNIESEIIPINGIQTSKNEVYTINKDDIIDETDNTITFIKKKNSYQVEKKILKEYYKASNSKKGKSYQKLENNFYVIFPYIDGKIIPENELKLNFPNTWNYFCCFKEKLLPRIMGGERDVQGNENDIHWYQYGRSQHLKEINNSKIIVGVMSNEPNFNIDRNNALYTSGGTAGYIGLLLKENSKYSLEYIQAWLSHPFTDKLFQVIGSQFEGNWYTHGTSTYKKIPLLPIDFDNKNDLEIFNKINKLVNIIEKQNEDIMMESSPSKKQLLIRAKEEYISKINNLIDKLLEIKMGVDNE